MQPSLLAVNPFCDRPHCRHPLRGKAKTGHFNVGAGPCKAPGCACTAFRSADPGPPLRAVGARVP